MSVLSTLADPSAVVISTGIISYVAKKLGNIKVGTADLSDDVKAGWDDVKKAASKVDPVVATIPGIQSDVAKALQQLSTLQAGPPAADALEKVVETEVQRQFAELFPGLVKPSTEAPPAT